MSNNSRKGTCSDLTEDQLLLSLMLLRIEITCYFTRCIFAFRFLLSRRACVMLIHVDFVIARLFNMNISVLFQLQQFLVDQVNLCGSNCQLTQIGSSTQGRPLNVVTVGILVMQLLMQVFTWTTRALYHTIGKIQ
jgi:hypothetical protein